jgi:hypothetical protein
VIKTFLIISQLSGFPATASEDFVWRMKQPRVLEVQSISECLAFKKKVDADEKAEIDTIEGKEYPTSLYFSPSDKAKFSVTCAVEVHP